MFANDGGACHAKQVVRLLVKNKHACNIVNILICSITMACRACRYAFDRPPLCELDEGKKSDYNRIRCLAVLSLFPKNGPVRPTQVQIKDTTMLQKRLALDSDCLD